MTKAKFTGKINSLDKIWENYVNIEMHKYDFNIVHKENEFWVAELRTIGDFYICFPSELKRIAKRNKSNEQVMLHYIEEYNIFINDVSIFTDKLKPWPEYDYFIFRPNHFEELKCQSGCYCSKCKEYFPYADYEESFKCWRCKNGF